MQSITNTRSLKAARTAEKSLTTTANALQKKLAAIRGNAAQEDSVLASLFETLRKRDKYRTWLQAIKEDAPRARQPTRQT